MTMQRDRVAVRMKDTWNAPARKNTMHYIATGREDWDLESFLASGRKNICDLLSAMDGWPLERQEMALDLGCGIGRLSFALADISDRVIGVDVSEVMIDEANRLRQQLGYSNVEFRCNNGRALWFVATNSCDLGLSLIVLQHIPDRNIALGYISELARVVKPGGYVIFQVPVYQRGLLVYPWRLFQTLFRGLLWRIEALGIIPPEKGVAFRGTRMSLDKIRDTIHANGLEIVLTKLRRSNYRLCNNTVMFCRKCA